MEFLNVKNKKNSEPHMFVANILKAIKLELLFLQLKDNRI